MENEPKGYLSKLLLWIKTKHVILFASALAVAIAIYGAKAIGSPVKAKPIPEGWVFRGQSLATADNQILPGGDILQLPEKLTLKALTDCAVRIAPKNKSGMQQVAYATNREVKYKLEIPPILADADKAGCGRTGETLHRRTQTRRRIEYRPDGARQPAQATFARHGPAREHGEARTFAPARRSLRPSPRLHARTL